MQLYPSCEGYEGETRTLESLQFQFSTIRVATDNFSDANKLGEGGFGSVYKVIKHNHMRENINVLLSNMC